MHFLIFLQELTTALHESVEEGECPFHINHFMSESSRHVGGGGGQALGRLHSMLPRFRLSYHANLYGKPFYYLSGNVDIIFIYKISFILYQISNKIY